MALERYLCMRPPNEIMERVLVQYRQEITDSAIELMLKALRRSGVLTDW